MAPLTAVMECPNCRRVTKPDDASTAVIAWYLCEGCGHHWSARLRNGVPDGPHAIPQPPLAAGPNHHFTSLVCPHCEQPVAHIVKADVDTLACECPNGFCWTAHAKTR